MTEGTDYNAVSYFDNINAGTAKGIITGTGDYRGTVNKNFTIGKADAPTGMHQTLEVIKKYAKNYDFNLTSLLPNVSGTLGTVIYSPDITLNDDNVLGELDYRSGDTFTLPVKSVAGVNKTAVVQVTVSSTNYKDFSANITVKTLENPSSDDSGGGYLNPTAPTTRPEMVQMLYNLLGK